MEDTRDQGFFLLKNELQSSVMDPSILRDSTLTDSQRLKLNSFFTAVGHYAVSAQVWYTGYCDGLISIGLVVC